MTTPRLGRTLVALSATAALVLAGCGDEEPEVESTPATADSPTASESPSPSKSKSTKPAEESSSPPAADEVVVDVTIAGGEVTPVAEAVKLGVGEPLIMAVESDRPGELHVHSSPEQLVDFVSGTSRLELTFDKPGSVDIEEHDSGALIARVLVQ